MASPAPDPAYVEHVRNTATDFARQVLRAPGFVAALETRTTHEATRAAQCSTANLGLMLLKSGQADAAAQVLGFDSCWNSLITGIAVRLLLDERALLQERITDLEARLTPPAPVDWKGP